MQPDVGARPDLARVNLLAGAAVQALQRERDGDVEAVERFRNDARATGEMPRTIAAVLEVARDQLPEARDLASGTGVESRPRPVPKLADPAYRGLLGDIVRAMSPHTEASPVAILMQILVMFGSACGAAPHVMVGATRHGTNENVLIVGRSSRARKGDSAGAARRVLSEADPIWDDRVKSGLSSGEGLIYHVRDPIERPNRKGEIEIVDPGEIDKRLLVMESEFAQVLKVMSREGNTLSTVLRCAWDGQRTLGTLTKSSPTQATGAHVSVIGHATPADLHRYLQDTEAANGFANRFSIVEVERAQVLPCPGTVDPAVITALADRMRRTLHVARSRGEMRRTPEADIVCKEAYPVLSADRPGMVGDLLARAEAHVLRFSMLYALADGAETIDVPYLESALAIWDVVEESVLSIFAGRTGNTDADRIVAAIGPGERMTRSEISAEIFQRHATAARIDTAIQIVASLPNWRLTVEPTAGRSADVLERLS